MTNRNAQAGERIDPGMGFWIDGEHPTQLPDPSWDDVDGDTSSAFKEASVRAEEDGDWEEAAPQRTWLRERYPHVSEDQFGRHMLDWHQRFRRDPASAREAWARTWSKEPPFLHPPRAVKKDEPPSDLTEQASVQRSS